MARPMRLLDTITRWFRAAANVGDRRTREERAHQRGVSPPAEGLENARAALDACADRLDDGIRGELRFILDRLPGGGSDVSR